MADAWEAGRVVTSRRCATFADGLAVRVAIPYAVAVLAVAADRMLRVSEREIALALGASARAGLRVEGAAGAALAALPQLDDVEGRSSRSSRAATSTTSCTGARSTIRSRSPRSP